MKTLLNSPIIPLIIIWLVAVALIIKLYTINPAYAVLNLVVYLLVVVAISRVTK